jgi:hypothetical protein
MKELLDAIEVERTTLFNIEVEAALTISKTVRGRLCRRMHQTEQLLAALEEQLDAIINPTPAIADTSDESNTPETSSN